MMKRTLLDVYETIAAGSFYEDYDQSIADLRILREAAEHKQTVPFEVAEPVEKNNAALSEAMTFDAVLEVKKLRRKWNLGDLTQDDWASLLIALSGQATVLNAEVDA